MAGSFVKMIADGINKVFQPPEADGDCPCTDAGVIAPQNVFFGEHFETRDELLDFLSKRAVERGLAASAEELLASFLEREAEGTTGMADGFAIPHAKSPTVTRASVLVVRDAQGVSGWDTMDKAPVEVAIALLIPSEHAGMAHLRVLSRVAEAMVDDGFREQVKAAETADEIARIIADRLH